jgi:predicted nuclease of predicted toxin-antitoxin system
MKLLLDGNLSRRIAPFIQESYPDSTQVALIGLEQADDKIIRQFAIDNGYVIVTKDADSGT